MVSDHPPTNITATTTIFFGLIATQDILRLGQNIIEERRSQEDHQGGLRPITHHGSRPPGGAVGPPWPSDASSPIVTALLLVLASGSASSRDWLRRQ